MEIYVINPLGINSGVRECHRHRACRLNARILKPHPVICVARRTVPAYFRIDSCIARQRRFEFFENVNIRTFAYDDA